ncbi:MAG: hypothetical protein ACJAR8_001918, partial [Bacteroidia bacterium]
MGFFICIIIYVQRRMEISAKYNPEGLEQKWYDQWMAHKLFSS